MCDRPRLVSGWAVLVHNWSNVGCVVSRIAATPKRGAVGDDKRSYGHKGGVMIMALGLVFACGVIVLVRALGNIEKAVEELSVELARLHSDAWILFEKAEERLKK
jgi:hypothetical protein